MHQTARKTARMTAEQTAALVLRYPVCHHSPQERSRKISCARLSGNWLEYTRRSLRTIFGFPFAGIFLRPFFFFWCVWQTNESRIYILGSPRHHTLAPAPLTNLQPSTNINSSSRLLLLVCNRARGRADQNRRTSVVCSAFGCTEQHETPLLQRDAATAVRHGLGGSLPRCSRST